MDDGSGEMTSGGGIEGLEGRGTLRFPSLATYRSEPLRRRSLVRAVISGLETLLVISICWGLGAMRGDFLLGWYGLDSLNVLTLREMRDEPLFSYLSC